jgi:hypothetical protein
MELSGQTVRTAQNSDLNLKNLCGIVRNGVQQWTGVMQIESFNY